jgi:hypothetical protein
LGWFAHPRLAKGVAAAPLANNGVASHPLGQRGHPFCFFRFYIFLVFNYYYF